jgi:hypothetical protein
VLHALRREQHESGFAQAALPEMSPRQVPPSGRWPVPGHLLVHLHERPRIGGCSDRVTARGRFATWVPVARDATMSCAADSFSYAARTVPRATPSCAARSCHDGRRAPGASTPRSIATPIPIRICSISGVFAERSSFNRRGLVTGLVVHDFCAFLVLFSDPEASRLQPTRCERRKGPWRRLRLCHAERAFRRTG